MGIAYNTSVVRDGLVLQLDAANAKSYPGTGNTWNDLSGGVSNFSLSASVAYDSQNLGVLTYNGIDSSASGTIQQSTIFTGITINIFYNSNTSSSTALFVGSLNYALLHFRGAGFYLVADDSTVSGYLGWNPSSLTQLVANQWNMITATWDGISMKLYTNTVKQATELGWAGGVNRRLRTPYSTSIGGFFNTTQPWTNGKLGSCQVYNRALSAAEIAQNFEAHRGRYNI